VLQHNQKSEENEDVSIQNSEFAYATQLNDDEDGIENDDDEN